MDKAKADANWQARVRAQREEAERREREARERLKRMMASPRR